MPAQKVLRGPLTELERVSVACLGCDNAVELKIADIARRYLGATCPFCNAVLFNGEPRSRRILQLAGLIEDLRKDKAFVDVRFVLPIENQGVGMEEMS